MSLYPVIETLVIGGALALSVDRALRQLAPAARRAVLGWFAARLGLRPPTAPPATGGCDSGCGTCGTGCGSSTTPTTEAGEQPLQFVRKTPTTKP